MALREREPIHPTDADLARRIAQQPSGTARAEESELYRRLAPRVRLYGLRHLRDEHAAADLVQHVMALTIEKLRSGAVREPERIGSFVLGAARMAARDLRRTGQRGQASSELLDEVAETLGVEPAEPLDLEQLGGCLDALAERDRTVIVLTFYDERTSGQIASQLGLSEGNVRVVRHRALAQLQRCMGLDLPRAS
jgi:RNA polymerase sigma-70 factor (ECF subfamily)